MKIFRLLFFVLFFCTGAASSYALDWKSLNEEVDRLSIAQAESLYAQAPDSGERLFVLGAMRLKHHQYDEAEKTFKEALKKDPQMFEARWGMAEVFCFRHEFEKSTALIKEIVKAHPSFVPAYVTWAYIKYMTMDFKGSAELSAEAINFPEDAVDTSTLVRAHGLYAAAKGMLAEHGGMLSKSLNFFAVKKHLKIASSLQPDSFTANMGWGSFYLSIPAVLGRDLDKAEAFLKKAVEVDPLFPDTYVRLAQVAKARGDEQKYNKFLAKALALDPKNELAADIKNGTCKFICLDKKR